MKQPQTSSPDIRKKELSTSSFKRIGGMGNQGYFSYKDDKYEICLEPCMNGYEVAIYDLRQDLLKPKICTNLEGSMDIMPGFNMVQGEALLPAVKLANKLLRSQH